MFLFVLWTFSTLIRYHFSLNGIALVSSFVFFARYDLLINPAILANALVPDVVLIGREGRLTLLA